MAPREPALREAVQAERQVVALPGLVDGEPEAVGLDGRVVR
jgi:hypothetical protein